MTRQEKVFINNQIYRLRKQKDSEIDMFIGRMEAIMRLDSIENN